MKKYKTDAFDYVCFWYLFRRMIFIVDEYKFKNKVNLSKFKNMRLEIDEKLGKINVRK